MRRMAVGRKTIEKAAADFEISDNLRQFFPPRTNFTIGVRTAWFKDRVKAAGDDDKDCPKKAAKDR